MALRRVNRGPRWASTGLRSLLALVVTAAPVAFVAPAHAATDPQPAPIESNCLTGWYVNPDENGDGDPAGDDTDLRPTQQVDGLLFDGPSLMHHATSYTLESVPTDGSFVANVSVGVAPLFKMETLNQYSTINKTADGKYWSSKITATDPGGQNNPVATPADLIGLWSGYTTSTQVFSFGVGYANDAGNTALVSSITFAGTTYDLTCEPTPAGTSAPAAKPQLPTTGSSLTWLIYAGAGLVILGAVVALLARRRRTA